MASNASCLWGWPSATSGAGPGPWGRNAGRESCCCCPRSCSPFCTLGRRQHFPTILNEALSSKNYLRRKKMHSLSHRKETRLGTPISILFYSILYDGPSGASCFFRGSTPRRRPSATRLFGLTSRVARLVTPRPGAGDASTVLDRKRKVLEPRFLLPPPPTMPSTSSRAI